MANPNDIVTDIGGLEPNPNELNVAGAPLSVAKNVVINRDGMVEKRRGFVDFSSNLPAGLTPDQLFESGGVLYGFVDNGLWYYDTATSSWLRKAGQTLTGAYSVSGLWIDAGGTNFYFSDNVGHAVWVYDRVLSRISLIAGFPGTSGTANGTGQVARFNNPGGLWGDNAGNLFLADTTNHSIRKIVIATGVVTTLAGLNGTAGNINDPVGANARFTSPTGLWSNGTNLYVCETASGRIRQVVKSSGATTQISVAVANPVGVWCDAAATSIFVTDDSTNTIKTVVIATGVATTLATLGTFVLPGSGFPYMFGDATYVYTSSGDFDLPRAFYRVLRTTGAIEEFSVSASFPSARTGVHVVGAKIYLGSNAGLQAFYMVAGTTAAYGYNEISTTGVSGTSGSFTLANLAGPS